MSEAVVVFLCSLVFTGSMTWLNMRTPRAPFMRPMSAAFIVIGSFASLVSLGVLFDRFIQGG